MKVPKDQGLFFSLFFSVCLGIILMTWFFLPVYHREMEETTEGQAARQEKLATPEALIKKAEKVLIQVEEALSQLSSPRKEKPNKPQPSKQKVGS